MESRFFHKKIANGRLEIVIKKFLPPSTGHHILGRRDKSFGGWVWPEWGTVETRIND
jgi:hypothetical protein